MIWLPAGSFNMGSKDGDETSFEIPIRKNVQVDAFGMAKTEVTVQQYLSCVNEHACDEPEWQMKGGKYHYQTGTNDLYRKFGNALVSDLSPIVGVSWRSTQQYVQWLSEKTGKNYRLPSEAEWKYACKAGKETMYCGSDSVGQVGWTKENSGGKLHAVASIVNGANGWGLVDMSGNAVEWVQDCWHSDYKDAPRKGGVWEGGNCELYTVRGGSWDLGPWFARATFRTGDINVIRGYILGFRVSRTAR